MSAHRPRPVRRSLGALAALTAAAFALTACAASPSASEETGGGEAAGDGVFPTSVEHVYGTTEIPAQPERVGTIGWGSFDAAIALGVVPVSIGTSSFGGDAEGYLPWTREAIEADGAKLPALHDELDGAPYEVLADAGVDLILGTNSGLSEQEYTTLSKIAPTVAYETTPWGTPWRDSTRMVGAALGMPDAAAQLIADTEEFTDTEMAKYPEVAGKTGMVIWVDAKDAGKVQYYTPNDTRLQYLTDLGLEIAPSIVKLSEGSEEFVSSISAEEADTLDADVAVVFVQGGGDLSTLREDPLLSKIPAVQSGALVYIEDDAQLMAISSPTPLSIPWALPAYAKQLGEAAAQVK
ncbi:ABC transporter substrate-binding protein [Leucobacter chromiireducens]|uniref:ABC transporter substrate-binding protein n=1 Tax=Leucobacter chromiireducens TaxID=283877 RepID=UPI000F642FD5|nr:ABC transporter substrate-binding protein [Leucobacter chromiireducens]